MLEVSLCKTLSAVVMAVASGQVADIDSLAGNYAGASEVRNSFPGNSHDSYSGHFPWALQFLFYSFIPHEGRLLSIMWECVICFFMHFILFLLCCHQFEYHAT